MLQALRDNGTLRLVDVVAYHPYSDTPEGDPDPADPNNFVSRAKLLNQFLRDAGVKAIWATEFGWSTYTGPYEAQTPISPAQQADYLVRRLTLMRTLGFERIFIFALTDLDARVTPRDQHYGMMRLDGSQKPSYPAVKAWILNNP
jgi:beta-xylosidase